MARATAGAAQHAPAPLSIGVLDIFGFEALETNSVEQLLINYANERLQSLFTQQVLAAEQDEYAAEGVTWQRVAYRDNAPLLALLEQRPNGALALLDEECVLPGGDEARLLDKYDASLPGVASSAARALPPDAQASDVVT
jgi:myosin heavy subunit